jgi:hypothetical protein
LNSEVIVSVSILSLPTALSTVFTPANTGSFSLVHPQRLAA